MSKNYIQHKGKVINTDDKFSHVMAITLDPTSNYRRGVLRCITSREGDVTVKGYVDRSKLYLVEGNDLESFEIKNPLVIKGEEELIKNITPEGWECIGFEDPDIWIDDVSGLINLYFTIPVIHISQINGVKEKTKIHLGHAVGKDLDSLEIKEPVLKDELVNSAKEVSIVPLNSKGFRLNLIESRDRQPKITYSTVMAVIAKDMNGPWEYHKTVFNPKDHSIPWVGGHASPGPLFPRSFINMGENKVLGILNGREANTEVDGITKYNMFSAGLFVYNYEDGKVEWVSPESFIEDTEAITITFASQFVETGKGEGILYAHVDDSFVRAYTLTEEGLRKQLAFWNYK